MKNMYYLVEIMDCNNNYAADVIVIKENNNLLHYFNQYKFRDFIKSVYAFSSCKEAHCTANKYNHIAEEKGKYLFDTFHLDSEIWK